MQSEHLERLKKLAGRHNKLIKKSVELDGEDFTFWHRPMTITEYTEAKTRSKNPEDVLENAVRLFIAKACDAQGNQLYQVDAIPVLQRQLPMELASKLVGALQANDEEDEEELDMKSDKASAKKG